MIPLPRSAISSLEITLTRFVRSPSPLSIPSIISLISLLVAIIGLITYFITQYIATIINITLIIITIPLLTSELAYTLVSLSLASEAVSLACVLSTSISFWIAVLLSLTTPLAIAYASSVLPKALYAIMFPSSYFIVL